MWTLLALKYQSAGHCTGRKAYGVLAGVMGDALRPFHTGTSVEV
jgi:metal-dependent hydrolase (beta-lactamase superfamily II)